MKKSCVAIIFAGSLLAPGASFTADSERGRALFTSLDCIHCHSVNGRGGSIAPDLGKIADRDFTPASLNATLWNHAPKMWSAMKQYDIRAGRMDEQGAADLLAFFYSARFFERPGDAGRGLRLFSEKHCADCHGLRTRKIPEAKPVVEWDAVYQPVALVDAMWNHAAEMRGEFAKRKWAWPTLDPQEMADILVYLRAPGGFPPAATERTGELRISSGADGKQLFESKGCSGCHQRTLGLETRVKHMTLTDIAAEMWNHAPKMSQRPPQISPDEMQDLISYIWAQEFFEDAGNAGSGRKVFESKHCAGCHEAGTDGAPKLPSAAIPISGPGMIAALWHHGPRMMEQMNSKHIRWPEFTAEQMSNLIAYLNSGASAK